jgi:hypothetical protein
MTRPYADIHRKALNLPPSILNFHSFLTNALRVSSKEISMFVIVFTAILTLGVLFVAMNMLDPVLSRLSEIKECLQRLENIRRIQKEMHDFGYEWWMLDLMRQRDELSQRRSLEQEVNASSKEEATP